MTTVLDGWFLASEGLPYAGNGAVKSYLTVFNACAGLGPLATGVFINSEIRLFLGGQRVTGKVLHVHGRFSVVSPADEAPFLQIEVHRFDVMNKDEATDEATEDKTPDTVCCSMSVCGRAVPSEGVSDGRDMFFALEVEEYIRDHTQKFIIRCRLNKNNKRWANANLPIVGSQVLVSGFLSGDSPTSLYIEVETMHFIQAVARGMEGGGSSQSPGKSKFGVPTRVKAQGSATSSNSPKITSQGSAMSLDSPSPSPQMKKPLSMLPVPALTTTGGAQAGPSVTTPAKATRAATKRKSASGSPSAEPTTANEEGSPSAPKRKRRSTKRA